MTDDPTRLPDPTAEFSAYPPILDTAGAAQMLGLKIAKLQELCRNDLIPYRRMPGRGRVYHFLRDELVEWFTNQIPGVETEVEAEVGVERDTPAQT